jgi:hypothetical protein
MAPRKRDVGLLTPDPGWTPDVEPAPGELRIVHALINTADRKSGTDELTDPRALAGWLTRWGLIDAAKPPRRGRRGSFGRRRAAQLSGQPRLLSRSRLVARSSMKSRSPLASAESTELITLAVVRG